jgi:hypothetical protein
MELKKDPNYQRPRPIPGDPPPRLAHKYCAFHDSYGHLTEQCVSLRQLIEKFIENGKLVRFLVNERNHQERDQYPRPRREEDRNERRIINRDKKKEEEEAESQHLDLGGTKEGREAGADLGWRSKAISLSSTLSREDLEEEASPTRLGRRMPGSWMISRYIRSRSLQSLGNITLWL